MAATIERKSPCRLVRQTGAYGRGRKQPEENGITREKDVANSLFLEDTGVMGSHLPFVQ